MKNKKIIKFCPNFYKIANYELNDGDLITKKILNIYKSYIFNIDVNIREEKKKAIRLDKVVSKYLYDYHFLCYLKHRFLYIEIVTTENIVNSFVDNILNIYESYIESSTQNIRFAEWI